MPQAGNDRKHPTGLKRYAFRLAIAWTAAIALGTGWQLREVRLNTPNLVRIQANLSFETGLVYRRRAVGHGGVYRRRAVGHGGVYRRVTERTPPSPYLFHIENCEIETWGCGSDVDESGQHDPSSSRPWPRTKRS